MKITELLEAEGEPSGVPHLTPEIAHHIIQQLGTEGVHAIVKSIEWGDGAAKELIQLFKHALEQYAYKNEGVSSYSPPVIDVGDEVRVGKFKNRRAEVKGFTTDKNNQPVLKTNKGDQQLFKPRIVKLMKDKK